MASFRHAREDFRPAMNEAFGPIRLIHILAGAIALVIGPLAMITFKGGRWHRRWGKIYFWAMATVALTALIMCWLRSGLFLFLVAIFSFYLALTGYTVLRRKTPQDRPQPLDWIAALTVCLASVTLIVYGGFWVQSSARWICLAFGIIGLFRQANGDAFHFRQTRHGLLQIIFEVADALLGYFDGIFESIHHGMGFSLPYFEQS